MKKLNVKKGDVVCTYMQMIPELAFVMLACARIGAIHSVVFGAFGSDALAGRINDSKVKVLVTQNYGIRGEKFSITMKNNCDQIIDKCPSVDNVIVIRRSNEECNMVNPRDV